MCEPDKESQVESKKKKRKMEYNKFKKRGRRRCQIKKWLYRENRAADVKLLRR
jgi:hypothetical protein